LCRARQREAEELSAKQSKLLTGEEEVEVEARKIQ
jgi:hypothetical protein